MVFLPVTPFVWAWPASPLVWLLMAGLGCFGALGHWMLILAHRRAPASVLAPFFYAQLLWATALGFVVFGEVPDRWTILGGAIVMGSGPLSGIARARATRRGGGRCTAGRLNGPAPRPFGYGREGTRQHNATAQASILAAARAVAAGLTPVLGIAVGAVVTEAGGGRRG